MGVLFKQIILEELIKFINEGSEDAQGYYINYDDDDIVDYKKINRQREFNKYNAMFFNNLIPSTVINWDNKKRAMGHVKITRNRLTGKAKVSHMSISKFFQMTYKQFKNTFVHEMIHLYLIAIDDENKYDNHGRNFMREAQRINSMGNNFNITATNTEPLEVSDDLKMKTQGKPLIALIIEIDGKYVISVTTPSVYSRDISHILQIFNHHIQKGRAKSVEITAVESTNHQLLRYRVARSYAQKINIVDLNDDLLNDLLDEKIINTVVLGKNSVDEDGAGEWVPEIII
jgi:hypothetical protein